MAAIGRPRSCNCGDCSKCKRRVYVRQWYASKSLEERRAMIARRDPEKVRANERRRYVRDRAKRRALADEWAAQNPERVRELHALDRQKHPEKRAARQAVLRAVQTGRLVRGRCVRCGAERTHAHHPDYSKALDVVWLCPTHHGEEHAA